VRPLLSRLLKRTRRADIEAVFRRAALPAELESVIRTTLRRARLWKSEQLDIARELTAHFADGLANHRDPPQMIAEFGDPAPAAKLIRRAKRRSRPLWWRTWRMGLRGLGVFILLMIGVYGVLAARYFTGRPTITHNYVAELNAPIAAIPESDRAWPIYRQALLELEPLPQGPSGLGQSVDSISTSSPGDPGWPEMQAYIERNARPIELFRRAADKPAMGATLDNREGREFAAEIARRHHTGPAAPTSIPPPPIESESETETTSLFAVVLTPVTHARTIARVLRADFDIARERGDAPRALSDLHAMTALSDHLREQPFLITELVAQAIDATAFESIKQSLVESPDLFPTGELIDLAHRIGAAADPADRLCEVVKSERLGFLDAMQRLYTDDGRGDGRLTAAGMRMFAGMLQPLGVLGDEYEFSPAPLAPVAAGTAISRREAVAFYDRIMADTVLMLRAPRWQRDPMASPDLKLVSRTEGLVNAVRYWPARMLVPALGHMARTADLQRATIDSTLIAIALELHRREHSAYPATLAELSPRLLPIVPLDLLDGKPLRYRLIAGRPVVYSVGPDLVDDDGRPMKLDRRSILTSSTIPTEASMGSAGYRQWLELSGGDWILYPTPAQPAPPAPPVPAAGPNHPSAPAPPSPNTVPPTSVIPETDVPAAPSAG
jgi:hypothetical protein